LRRASDIINDDVPLESVTNYKEAFTLKTCSPTTNIYIMNAA
jgi:hypothetical protein